MKLFSGFLLVLAFLAVSACTGSDETITIIEKEIECSDGVTIVTDPNECPSTEDTSNNNTSGNQGGSTGGQTDTPNTSEPSRSDCTPVQGVDLMATSQDDIICGNERDNKIEGLAGDDTIYGGPGNDILIGGKDRDVLKGEAGNDTLRGGEDNDILDGGAGTDTADYSEEQQPATGGSADTTVSVEVDLAEGQATDTYMDDDTLISIENVIGTPGNDTIIGDDGPNEIEGGGVASSEGLDTLNGGGGSDTIVVTSTFSFDPPTEGFSITSIENIKAKAKAAGSIDLTGNDKNNVLTGNEGENTLNGKGGNDRLIGGAGADCFIIKIPDADGGFADVADPPNSSSSDPNNAFRKTAIRSTRDTISDYGAEDEITIDGATGTSISGTPESKAAAVKSVIIYKGRIDVVTQAYRAAVTDEDTPANNITGISQQTETLVTVPGLPAGSNKVSIGATCPN